MSKGKDTESSGPTILDGAMEKKLDTSEVELPQPPTFTEALTPDLDDEGWDRPIEVIVGEADAEKVMSQAERLAFNEEPVVIYIQPNMASEHPDPGIPMWINGKGAEIYDKGAKRWLELGMLPIGGNIITRRKYVTLLAQSRAENVKTRTWKDNTGEAHNEFSRHQAMKHNFQIVHDWNKKERERWFQEVMGRRS